MQNVNKISKNMAERLNQLLESHGMTQQDLADVLGVSQTAVYSWCNGKKTPRMDKVDKIAEYFNVKRSYILGLDDENKSSGFLEILNVELNRPHESTDFKTLQRILKYASAILSLPKDKQKQITDYIDYIIKKDDLS